MGYGAGLAGFVNGIAGGMQLGKMYKQASDEDKLAKVREQGMAEARALQAKASPQVTDNGDMQNLTSRPQMNQDPMADRSVSGAEAAIPGFMQQAQAAEVQRQGWQGAEAMSSRDPKLGAPEPVADPRVNGLQLTQPKRFRAGAKEFDSQADADAYSKSQAPDLETFYAKTLVPKMRDQLVSMGRMKEAGEWEKYAEESTTKAHLKTWSKAFAYAQKEDYEGSAQELMKLYPDYDDGFELVSSKKDKGPNGEDGFTMVVKDAEGKERSVFHDAKTITEVGLAQLSPIEMFNQRFKRQNAADTLEARAAIDKQNDGRTLDRSLTVEQVRQKAQATRQDSRLSAADKAREDKQTHDKERDAARAANAKELTTLRPKLAAELRAQIKKTDDPAKMRLRAYEVAAKNPMWATMNEDEREAEAGNILEFARSESAAPAPAGGAIANPFAGGTKPKGVPVFRNGTIEYR